MNITDLITDRMHENLNPRDIDTVERYRWLIEMIATEYAGIKVKNLDIPRIINCTDLEPDFIEALNKLVDTQRQPTKKRF